MDTRVPEIKTVEAPEGIEGAGSIDCLKDTPEGPAQGLLAVGPLLKRAIEEKCRK